ncbi:uncharacterized protein LOC124818651 isoform X1 [Hydra vulgaris]|uniref:uncharacterized protein LOC124818651 isoform X1 n=1 Tax=Hydra vulgaris TaxID=6087 RepID=UPI001F5E7B4F|nr:uncharacterized protein LOC124818651 isoform X1 [Hydra vulgaris]
MKKSNLTSFLIISFLYLVVNKIKGQIPESCPKRLLSKIPDNHLYHKKNKPIYIGHRGQPKVYLENTLEGIKSTVDIKADGYELDIFLTKDKKLIVFHYENTLDLAGVNKNVSDCTYDELLQLNLTDNVIRGGKEYRFKSTSKIPLLEDVLTAMKDTDLLHVLEMKPEYFDRNDHSQSEIIGQKVAKLVTEMNLVEKVVVISFDYRKIRAAKKENENLVVGSLVMNDFSLIPKSSWDLGLFPELQQCFFEAPNNTLDFYHFLIESGILFKAAGASLFIAGLNVYEERPLPNNTLKVLKSNYRNDINSGFYTAYSMYNTEDQNLAFQTKYKTLSSQGVEILITDDVERLRKLLQNSSAHKNIAVSSYFMVFYLLACSWFC